MANFGFPSTDQSSIFSSEASTQVSSGINFKQLVLDPITTFCMKLIAVIPDFLTALCVLVVGWVIGKILQFVVSFFLRRVGFDSFSSKIGLTKLLDDSGEKIAPHRWMGSLAFSYRTQSRGEALANSN